jgi:thiosulfate dehydrogenase (quinone) large subunit
VAFDWYRDFLLWLLSVGAEGFFGKLITYGQVLVGVALIFGAFVGLAAFFGAFMNWNFMMAGTASTNPMMFLVSLLLVLAWKVAGYYGPDRCATAWTGPARRARALLFQAAAAHRA